LIRAALVLAAALLVGPASLAAPAPRPVAAEAPRRIVSLNPCVDAILYRIADPHRIAGISAYSQDPAASSVPQGWAARFPGLADTAEAVLVMKPDLVIISRHTALATRSALERAGLRLLLVDVPGTVAESAAQVRTIAQAIGNPAGGARLNAEIARALAAARPPAGARPVPALIYLGSGLVPGRDTLADELLHRAGFTNQSVAYGLSMWDVLPLEPLLARPPRVIFTPLDRAAPNGSFGAAGRALRARALGRLRGRTLVADYPESLLHCAGPSIARAATTLAAARRRVAR